MNTLRKLWLITKLTFRSVFGTTHGLRNVEQEMDFILGDRPIEKRLIQMRDLEEEDIPRLIQYWYHSPLGFIEGMGVDRKKLVPEPEFTANLRQKVKDNQGKSDSKLNVVVITYDGKPIGNHVINPLTEGEEGIFHAHIWEPRMRGKGVGLRSYVLASRVFMKRFNLKRILFKTPVQNLASIKVKEKLGIRQIGEETIGFGVVKDGTRAKVFELTREELDRMA